MDATGLTCLTTLRNACPNLTTLYLWIEFRTRAYNPPADIDSVGKALRKVAGELREFPSLSTVRVYWAKGRCDLRMTEIMLGLGWRVDDDEGPLNAETLEERLDWMG